MHPAGHYHERKAAPLDNLELELVKSWLREFTRVITFMHTRLTLKVLIYTVQIKSSAL
jgi:hypothetical protein